ncbi:MAG: SH3 domain-containing protein [Clostridia bacterium]|nr:SH3 domain-containing protein [Clostridia bacterium]
MKKCGILLAMVLMFTLTFSFSCFATTGKITGDNVRMREGNSTDYKIISYLKKGSEVNIITKDKDWYSVEYNTVYGWVSADYITVMYDEESNIINKIVDVSSVLNVRSGPETSYSVVGKVFDGDKVVVLEQGNTWDKIQIEDVIGWVKNEYLIMDNATGVYTVVESVKEDVYKLVSVSSKLNVRNGPGTSYSIVGKLNNGAKVKIIDTNNKWEKIQYNDIEGWVLSEYLYVSQIIKTDPLNNVKVIKTTTELNIREEANNDSKIISNVKSNEMLTVLEESNGWYKIKYNTKTGYIKASYTDDTELYIDTSKSTNQKVYEIIEKAINCFGLKYLWGGKTLSGFDCSGFVYYLYHSYVPDLGRSGKTQYGYGTTIEKDQLVAGDLIYFSSDGIKNISQPVTHVGIYIGNGIFIHAANTHRGVVFNSIESGYYYDNYLFSKRVL